MTAKTLNICCGKEMMSFKTDVYWENYTFACVECNKRFVLTELQWNKEKQKWSEKKRDWVEYYD